MNKDQLFIRTLEALEAKLESNDEYEVLMIAALLRKLLMDKNPLMDQVNRDRRQRIRFLVNKSFVPTDNPLFWSVEDTLDANNLPLWPIEVTKDQLFSCVVLMCEGHTITVKELIQHAAYVQGAIHADMPTNRKDEVLKDWTETLGIGGLPAGLRLLRTICRVVIKGLEPLKEQITE